MSKIDEIPVIIDIPKQELDKFDTLIKQYRTKYIRTSQEIVEFALAQNQEYLKQIKSKHVSKCISELREIVWQEYLLDEVNFNAILMRDLHKLLETLFLNLNPLIPCFLNCLILHKKKLFSDI